jgi:hypothetical protein
MCKELPALSWYSEKIMPAVARKDGEDIIDTNHGCDSETKTLEGSFTVFVNNKGVVRRGDKSAVHEIRRGLFCVSHQVVLDVFSPDVFADFKEVGRKGDTYQGERLRTGSPDVFANGL